MADTSQQNIKYEFTAEVDSALRGISKLQSSLSSLSKATSGISKLSSSISFLGKTSSVFKKLAGFAGGVALSKAITQSAERAIDYVETLNLFDTALKDSAEQGREFVSTMSEMYGLDPTYLAQYTGLFYEMGAAVQMPAEAATELSTSLTALTVDVASLFNYDFETVANKMQSGVRGMSRAVLDFGMDVRATTVQAYAQAHGIEGTYATMNEATREILRYVVMVNQASDAQGDFAKTIESPANQLRIFKEQAAQVGKAIGNFLVAPLAKVLPYLNAFLMVLKTILQALGEFFNVGEWIGSSIADVGDSTEEAVDGISGIGSAADNTAKKLKRLIAPFDELNILQEDAANTSGVAGGSLGSFGEVDPKVLQLLDSVQYKLSKVKMKAVELRDAMLDFLGIDISDGFKWDPKVFEANLINKLPQWKQSIQALFDVDWSDAWTQLKGIGVEIAKIAKLSVRGVVDDFLKLFGIEPSDSGIARFIKTLPDKLRDIKSWLQQNEDTIAKIGTRVLEVMVVVKLLSALTPVVNLLVGAFSLLAGAATLLSGVPFAAIGTALAGMFTGALKAIGAFNTAFSGILGMFSGLSSAIAVPTTALATLSTTNATTGAKMTSILMKLGAVFDKVLAVGAVGAIVAVIAAFGKWLITTEAGQQTLSNWGKAVGKIFEDLGSLIGSVFKFINGILDFMGQHFSSVFEAIGGVVNGLLGVLDGVIVFLDGVFSGDLDKALEGIKRIFKGAFESVVNLLVGVLNLGITVVEDALNFIGDSFLYFAKSLVSAIPIKGKDWSEKIPSSFNIDLPRIPAVKFASGGVVTGPTRALIGEAGRSEAVIPLDNSPQMLELVNKIAEAVQGGHNNEIRVYIGDKEWDTFTYKSAQRGATLVGAQPVMEGR